MEVVITQNKQELERLESVIQKNIGTFYEVGRALTEIREKKYYREVLGFETFEEYCKKRWDFASNYARRLIASAATVENIKSVPIGTFPATESQVRSLAKIKDPGAQREVWQKAVDTAPEGKVTAAHVYKIVKGLTGKEKTGTNKAKQNPARHFSNIAIDALKKIAIDDPARENEFSRVALWIVKNRRREK